MIPERMWDLIGEAFAAELRRARPDALCIARECSVSPVDPDVAVEVAAGAAVNLDTVEKPFQDRTPLQSVEVRPQRRKRSADRKPGAVS